MKANRALQWHHQRVPDEDRTGFFQSYLSVTFAKTWIASWQETAFRARRTYVFLWPASPSSPASLSYILQQAATLAASTSYPTAASTSIKPTRAQATPKRPCIVLPAPTHQQLLRPALPASLPRPCAQHLLRAQKQLQSRKAQRHLLAPKWSPPARKLGRRQRPSRSPPPASSGSCWPPPRSQGPRWRRSPTS